jgi:hypothetical protein
MAGFERVSDPDQASKSTVAGRASAARQVRRPQRLLVAGVVATVSLAAAGFALGRDVTSLGVPAKPAQAWLADGGAVSLVDGTGGTAVADVKLDGAGDDHLSVTQQGDTVLVHDDVTGRVTSIDTSQLQPAATVAGKADAKVLAGGGSVYVVDAAGGVVQRVDPTTLAALGAPVQLPGSLGVPVVDRSGTLWAPVGTDGTVVPVTAAGQGAPVHVATQNADLVMALADGVPVVVDRTAGQLTGLAAPAQGLVVRLPAAAGAADRLLVPDEDDGGPLPLVEAGPAADQLLLVDIHSRTPTAVAVPTAALGDQFGKPVQAAGRTFIPDFTTGAVLVYESSTGRFRDRPITVLGHPGTFTAQVINGIAYFNDPSGRTAVSVTGDGKDHAITKYGDGVPVAGTSPSSGTSTGSTASTAPSTGSHEPSGPPPTSSAPDESPTESVPQVTPSSTASGTESAPAPSGPPSGPPTDVPTSRPTTSAKPPTSPSRTPPPSSAPAGPPPAPGIPVTAVPGGSGTDVVVSWQQPANAAAIASYRVEVSPAAGAQKALSATSVDVTGLTCGTKYTFTPISVGRDNQTTRGTSVTSLACKAPAKPTLTLKPAAGDLTSLTASWVTTPGASYSLHYQGWGKNVTLKNVTGPGYKISGLDPYHQYWVDVTATNGGGTNSSGSVSQFTGSTGSSFTIAVQNFQKAGACGGPGLPICDAGIQTAPDIYPRSSHFSLNQGTGVTGYCQAPGYDITDDSGTRSKRWIYIRAGSKYGWAAAMWVGGPNAGSHLPPCPSNLPVY